MICRSLSGILWSFRARWCGASSLVPAKTSLSQLFGVLKVDPHISLFPAAITSVPLLFRCPKCHLSDLIARVKLQAYQTPRLRKNMWILPVLGYVGVILGFGFLTLAIGTFGLRSCVRSEG
jgi:hypothetical protein